MKLTKLEKETLNDITFTLNNLIDSVYKRKKNKSLYVALGQANMCLFCAKNNTFVHKFLIARAWDKNGR